MLVFFDIEWDRCDIEAAIILNLKRDSKLRKLPPK
jgi:hypothetical protein